MTGWEDNRGREKERELSPRVLACRISSVPDEMDALPIIAVSTAQSEQGVAQCRERMDDLASSMAAMTPAWRFLRNEDDFQGEERKWDIATDYDANVLVFFVLTGGVERRVLDFVLSCAVQPSVVLLLAHKEMNSFAAATEILAALRQRNFCGRIVQFVFPQDSPRVLALNSSAVREVADMRVLARARCAMQSAVVGVFGDPSDWLVASVPQSYEAVREKWGCRLVDVPLSEIAREFETMPVSEEVSRLADALVKNADKVCEPHGDVEIVKAVKLYVVLRSMVGRLSLTCVTVRCFDLIHSINTTACYALSRLNDEGVVSACEGDIATAVTMMLVRCVTGLESFMANPQRIDVSQNVVELAHCTLPLKMVQSYRVRTHFESGGAVALEGLFAPDDTTVTLLRIGGKKLEQVFLAVGNLLPQCPNMPSRCRSQVAVQLHSSHSVRYFLEAPLGNHHVLVLGNHEKRLSTYLSLFLSK